MKYSPSQQRLIWYFHDLVLEPSSSARNWAAFVIAVVCIIFLIATDYFNKFLRRKVKVFPIIIPAQVIVVGWARDAVAWAGLKGGGMYRHCWRVPISAKIKNGLWWMIQWCECYFLCTPFLHKVIVATGISYGARVQGINGTADEPQFGYAITGNIERGWVVHFCHGLLQNWEQNLHVGEISREYTTASFKYSKSSSRFVYNLCLEVLYVIYSLSAIYFPTDCRHPLSTWLCPVWWLIWL